MREITINRSDFRSPEDGDADFFNDIVVDLGLAKNYIQADGIDVVVVKVDSATIDD